MPQGLQVWDASGTLIIDTSTYVLKEIVINTTAVANTTATNYVSVGLPVGAVPIPAATVTYDNGDDNGPPSVEWDAANSRIAYKYGTTGAREASIKMMLV